MKKIIFILLVVLVNISSYGLVNSEVIKIGDIITLNDAPGNPGGEFILLRSDGAYLGRSFCLEMNEYGDFGQELVVANISNYADLGGVGGPHPDPLDQRTAYLYDHFARGNLTGYDYGAGREASAILLQQAIWWIEQEEGFPGSGINQFYDLATAAVNSGEWAGIGDVRVVNLVDLAGNKMQDQLTLVPEPGSMLLLGAGLLGISFIRRKKDKTNKK